jgi:hypothetical protein
VRIRQEVQEVPRRVVVVHFNTPNLDKVAAIEQTRSSIRFARTKR